MFINKTHHRTRAQHILGIGALLYLCLFGFPLAAEASTTVAVVQEVCNEFDCTYPMLAVIADGDTLTTDVIPLNEPLLFFPKAEVPLGWMAISKLYLVSDDGQGGSARTFIGGEHEIVFPSTGNYEIDVYASEIFLTQSRWSTRLLTFLTGATVAHAYNESPPIFIGTVRFALTDTVAQCEQDCYSNILFLPGIMASRLHNDSEQLWEPGNNGDVEQLSLDAGGKSIDSTIYTNGVIGELFGVGGNIYKSFLADLADLKTNDTIADYAAVPYDWRLSYADILSGGKVDAEGNISYLTATANPHIEQTLRKLASTSKSGQVTIIAHSNGGLLTKALINELGGEAADLIDQVVFVGVPQLGTPQAIGALLHGFKSGIPADFPVIVSESTARIFAENAPMSYQLLPHPDYYQNANTTISAPLISFQDGITTQPFIDAYGYAAADATELRDFLLGTEGRSAPAYADLSNPTIANETLLTSATAYMGGIGSNWTAPAGITVRQIAGTGEPTVAGLTYWSKPVCRYVTSGGGCVAYEDQLAYTPQLVLDGDGTVVTPSALLMSDVDPAVERWWINLVEYNDQNSHVDHKNLLEVNDVRSLILNKFLQGHDTSLTYVNSTQPTITPENRLSFILHSPLALSVIDADGFTVTEATPDSQHATFRRYGEVQVIDVYGDQPFTLQLTGEATGSFTLDLKQYTAGTLTATTTFVAIPSATSTAATMHFASPTISAAGELQIDYDGDGQLDTTLTPVVGELVQTPAPTIDTLQTAMNELPSAVINPLNNIFTQAQAYYYPPHCDYSLELLNSIQIQLNHQYVSELTTTELTVLNALFEYLITNPELCEAATPPGLPLQPM